MTDDELRHLLTETRTIAVVGHSDKASRDSYRISVYLRAEGYKIYPVNPNITTVLGLQAYPSLAEVPEPIDIVDVFRANQHVPGVVSETIAVKAKVLWTQLGVDVPEADRARLAAAGITLIENRCIRVAHRHLFGRAGT